MVHFTQLAMPGCGNRGLGSLVVSLGPQAFAYHRRMADMPLVISVFWTKTSADYFTDIKIIIQCKITKTTIISSNIKPLRMFLLRTTTLIYIIIYTFLFRLMDSMVYNKLNTLEIINKIQQERYNKQMMIAWQCES